MPVQKGKRRKRPRRRGQGEDVAQPQTGTPPSQTSGGRGLGLTGRRREMPPWLNLSVGVFLLLIGVVFSISSHKGFPQWEFAIILLGYLGLSGYYLSKGFRQFRARRGP